VNGFSISKADNGICESMFMFKLHVSLMQQNLNRKLSKIRNGYEREIRNRRMLIGSVASGVLSYGDALRC
jgi:hypothetical protein